MKYHRALALLLTLVSSTAQAGEPLSVLTPRGAKVEIIADKPAGRGPFPAVILASGASADMKQPIIQHTAEALRRNGITNVDAAKQIISSARGPTLCERRIEDLHFPV